MFFTGYFVIPSVNNNINTSLEYNGKKVQCSISFVFQNLAFKLHITYCTCNTIKKISSVKINMDRNFN
jgi:hypothetical protein